MALLLMRLYGDIDGAAANVMSPIDDAAVDVMYPIDGAPDGLPVEGV